MNGSKHHILLLLSTRILSKNQVELLPSQVPISRKDKLSLPLKHSLILLKFSI
jgi:hypothetical protein